mmetsp:Transcript_1866/g.4772  ORF Transcript_1866/g.4772 Transcript_1866/m.4772 type:complete len:99 (-) Transcript_1866:1003-1299(-)
MRSEKTIVQSFTGVAAKQAAGFKPEEERGGKVREKSYIHACRAAGKRGGGFPPPQGAWPPAPREKRRRNKGSSMQHIARPTAPSVACGDGEPQSCMVD